MSSANRRDSGRLRLDRNLKVPLHLLPDIPFIGEPILAGMANLSVGGMAIVIERSDNIPSLEKGTKIRAHIRLPGLPIQECRGVIAHKYIMRKGNILLGVRFQNIPSRFEKEIQNMVQDNQKCDDRILEAQSSWCLPTCNFFSLCRKPIRPIEPISQDIFEIALQIIP